MTAVKAQGCLIVGLNGAADRQTRFPGSGLHLIQEPAAQSLILKFRLDIEIIQFQMIRSGDEVDPAHDLAGADDLEIFRQLPQRFPDQQGSQDGQILCFFPLDLLEEMERGSHDHRDIVFRAGAQLRIFW